MKTLQTLAVALLLGSVWAQQGAIRIGAALVPQSSWLLNKDDSDAGSELDYEATWGFAGGVSLSYNFTDNLGAGLDILYSNQGQKYKGKIGVTPYTARTTLNYLKLPLLLRFNTDPGSAVQFNAFLGPQLNLLLSYRDRTEFTIPPLGTVVREVSGTEMTITDAGETEKEELTEPVYTGFLPGAALGLGIGIKLTDQLLISLHLRADYAFGDVENKDAKIDHTHHGGQGQDPYWENKPKYGGASTPADYKRPATAALTGGLQIGVYYTIGAR